MPHHYINPFSMEDINKSIVENNKRINEICEEIDKIYNNCLDLYKDVKNILGECNEITEEVGVTVEECKSIANREILK